MNVRRAPQVFDAVPRDVFEPLEVHDLFVHAENLLASKQVLLTIRWMGQLLRLDPDPERKGAVLLYPLLFWGWCPLAGDCINCIVICGLLWEQFMTMTETSVDTVCMYVVVIGLTIAPLLKTCFTMTELYPTHTTGCTLTFDLRQAVH